MLRANYIHYKFQIDLYYVLVEQNCDFLQLEREVYTETASQTKGFSRIFHISYVRDGVHENLPHIVQFPFLSLFFGELRFHKRALLFEKYWLLEFQEIFFQDLLRRKYEIPAFFQRAFFSLESRFFSLV